jgi:glutamate 5-kinase
MFALNVLVHNFVPIVITNGEDRKSNHDLISCITVHTSFAASPQPLEARVDNWAVNSPKGKGKYIVTRRVRGL